MDGLCGVGGPMNTPEKHCVKSYASSSQFVSALKSFDRAYDLLLNVADLCIIIRFIVL